MITFDKILLQNSCNPPEANVAIKWAEVVKLLSPGNNFYFTSSWWALVKICRSLKCLTKCFAVRLLLPFWYFSYQILPNARWFVTIWLDARNGLLLRHSGDSVERLHTDNSKFGCEPGKRNIWEQLDMTFPKGEEIHRVTRETWNSTFRYLKKKPSIIFGAKIQNENSHSILRAKRATLRLQKLNKNGQFLARFGKPENSVTRQVNFNRTKIGGKCQNSRIQMRHFQ